MVKTSYQYPQLLYAKITIEAIQLPNGSWQPETVNWQLTASCREETNGKGAVINTADGRTLAFSSLIQAQKGTARIDEGTEIIIATSEIEPDSLKSADFITAGRQTGLIVAQGVNLKCDPGRLHTRIWI